MVLKAAETIVIEEGFAALKVRKIALEIGYTVGSIYMVFDNMADLIMHVKGRTLDDLAQQLDQVGDHDDVEQCIVELAKAYLSFAVQNHNRWRMIFDQGQQGDDKVPGWYQEKVDQMFERVENLFRGLTPGQAEEQMRLAARALWGGVHGVCTLSLSGKMDLAGVGNVENVVVLLVENFLKGWEQTHQGSGDA